MKCKKCGCELGVGSQFCNQCGTKCEEEEKSIGQQPITKGKALFVLLVMVGIAYVSFSSSDKDSSQKERSTKSSVAEIDEDALADKNCKNELGFSNIYACRRALSSAGIDADKYIREKWITTGNRIKGIGFCEGFTRSKHSDQYKVHYDKNCNAKELYIWSDQLGDFQRIK